MQRGRAPSEPALFARFLLVAFSEPLLGLVVLHGRVFYELAVLLRGLRIGLTGRGACRLLILRGAHLLLDAFARALLLRVLAVLTFAGHVLCPLAFFFHVVGHAYREAMAVPQG